MLELMVVVAIAGILAAMAAPAMMEFIRANRLSAIARQLDADLLLARREAIKRNTRVLVCPVGTTAGKCGSGTTAWAQGWLVCYDADQSGDCDDTATANPNPIRQPRRDRAHADTDRTGRRRALQRQRHAGRGGCRRPDLHDQGDLVRLEDLRRVGQRDRQRFHGSGELR